MVTSKILVLIMILLMLMILKTFDEKKKKHSVNEDTQISLKIGFCRINNFIKFRKRKIAQLYFNE